MLNGLLYAHVDHGDSPFVVKHVLKVLDHLRGQLKGEPSVGIGVS